MSEYAGSAHKACLEVIRIASDSADPVHRLERVCRVASEGAKKGAAEWAAIKTPSVILTELESVTAERDELYARLRALSGVEYADETKQIGRERYRRASTCAECGTRDKITKARIISNGWTEGLCERCG